MGQNPHMTEQRFDVAVVGATGVVGEALVSLLEDRGFPLGTLHLLAGERSIGKRLEFKGKYLSVGNLADFDFSRVQLAFFAVPAAVAAQYVPQALAAGCFCIDNSAQYRYDDDVPLVVPEVNPAAICSYSARRLIASPDAATILLLTVLKPIADAAGVVRANVTTLQAVTAGGRQAMDELASQTVSLLSMREVKTEHHQKQIAFNVLPQTGQCLDNGYTFDELEMLRGSQKVLEDDAIVVNQSVVRVPVFYGHSLAVNIETREHIGIAQVREILSQAPGVELGEAGEFPVVATEATARNEVFVSRLHEDLTQPRGLNLWIVGDNVRKGAALNSVQVAEILVKECL